MTDDVKPEPTIPTIHPIKDLDYMFGDYRFLIPMADIPTKYRFGKRKKRARFFAWALLLTTSSRSDVASSLGLQAKNDIDQKEAERAIVCLSRSLHFDYYHKVSAMAYMLDSWFEPATAKVSITTEGKEDE